MAGPAGARQFLFAFFSTGGFILVSDYVRMEVTLVGASWDVVAGDQTGVDFIPMKFCGVPSRLALFLAFLKPGMSIFPIKQYT